MAKSGDLGSEMIEGIIRRVLRAVFGGGGAVDIDLPTEFDELKDALKAAVEAAIDSGIATGGSNITIVDTGKSWAVNMWADATFEVTIAGIHYLGIVTSNTADTITFPALAGGAVVVAGCEYALKRPVDIADISDRAARLLGVTYGSQAQQLQQRAATFELLVQLMSAGAEIDPRDVTDRAARLLGVIYGSQAAQIQQTAADNLKISHEEAAIAVPADIQARYNVKSIRDIAPGATGTFWLPETGSIDISNFIGSSWCVYAPTTATMVIDCYLNISHDGGTTWRRAAGYEIPDGDFVRDVWNSIDCPLKLAQAKLEVVIATAFPAELDLMCIRKA